mmetsp:Transcript_10763/g.33981  ORF Transcript_10763/g.33981 Transcript_10763/m.33981 type:complete len:257 (+) Transcript_10763:749-1519(+)
MRHWQLDRLLDLGDLRLEPADVCVRLERRLVDLHDRHHRVDVVRKQAYDGEHLVVHEDGAARLDLVLIDERHDVDVVLGSDRRRDDRVVVVDHLLERADAHRRPAQVVHLRALLLRLLLGGAEALLILDELLLHQQVVLNPLQLEQLELALRVRHDDGQLRLLDAARLLLLLLAEAKVVVVVAAVGVGGWRGLSGLLSVGGGLGRCGRGGALIATTLCLGGHRLLLLLFLHQTQVEVKLRLVLGHRARCALRLPRA